MRKIKFRGKRIDNGEWKYGDLLHIVGGCVIYHGSQKESELIEDRPNLAIELYMDEVSPVVPDTVGQFTGLHDRNGKDIYEGDVLGTEGKIVGWVKGGVRGYCYDVVYVNHPAGEKRWTLYSTVVDDYPNKIEVIGNIHDNPDLLLEKQQSKGVVLFGYPYLYQNGDLGFHEKMAELGLSRGDVILGGLPNKCILANKHEYFLVDYYTEEDFCEQYKLKATYSVDDFIQGIKELKGKTK